MACYDGAEVVAKPSLSYRQLSDIGWGGEWLVVIPILSLCRRRSASCDRLSEVTQYGPVESASGSVGQDGPCFMAKAFG